MTELELKSDNKCVCGGKEKKFLRHERAVIYMVTVKGGSLPIGGI